MSDVCKSTKIETNGFETYITSPCYRDLVADLGEDHWLVQVINSRYSPEEQRELHFKETLIIEKQGKTVIMPTPLEIRVS